MKKRKLTRASALWIAAVLCLLLVMAGCSKPLDCYDHAITGLLDGEDCRRNLLLQDTIRVKFFFTTDNAPENILYEGENIPVVKEPDGRYSVIIPDVPTTDFDKQIRFDFGHISVDTSVLAYIRDCLETVENETVRNVVKSLYKSYLHSR